MFRMTSPTYRTCRLRAVRTSGHRCEAVRGGGTVPDARGMVGRGGRRGARLSPRPCDPTGGGSENRKPVPAGLLLAGPAPARACLWSPLLKRTLLALPHEGCADAHSSSPGWAGTAKSKAAKEDMRKEDARRHVHSSESALISLHPTQLPQRAACARGLTSVDLSRRAGGLPVTILTSQTTHLTCLSRRHESRDSNVLPPSHTHALTSDHCKLCPSAWRAHSPGTIEAQESSRKSHK